MVVCRWRVVYGVSTGDTTRRWLVKVWYGVLAVHCYLCELSEMLFSVL
jgi:hypothetical protein